MTQPEFTGSLLTSEHRLDNAERLYLFRAKALRVRLCNPELLRPYPARPWPWEVWK